MNNFLLIIAAILVLVLTVLFAVPPMINWNDYRGAFEEEVSRLLDREVRVRGEVSVRILPVPYVSFEKVRIADAPGVPGSFARADKFKMWLSVPPLLRGVFEARQIELERPVIRLRTEADGSGNWRKLQVNKGHLDYIPRDVTLNSVRITDGTLLIESHHGHEIARLARISGEMIASGLAGPYKFIGTMPLGGGPQSEPQDVRMSTARIEDNGEVRFSGSIRSPDNTTVHNINGTLFDLLGSARAEGLLTSRSQPARSSSDAVKRHGAGYELTADVKLNAEALRLEKVAISFRNKGRQQTLNGTAVTSWREGVVTETHLAASWLDLDAIAGTGPDEGPLQVVENLLTRGIEPLGAGVTSVHLRVDQANLAGTAISDLKGRMVRRDGVTKIEALRASLPGRSSLAIDGFLERRETGLQFDGNVLMRSASFSEFVQWVRVDLGEDSQRALATSFALSGNIRVRPKSVELSDATLSLADATAEGGIIYSWSGRPALIANIDADSLALEKFGVDLLAPSRIASVMGFAPNGKQATAATPAWQRETDIALRLRASRITDGSRSFRDVDIDFGRNGDELNLARFNVTWDPGLSLALKGHLADLVKQPRGTISGVVGAVNDAAAANLIQLMSLAGGKVLPSSAISARTPLRVAIDATLAASPTAGAPIAGPYSRIIADGTIGKDRIRIDARTDGGLDRWMEQPAQVHARISGADAMVTTGWLLGKPLGMGAGHYQVAANRQRVPATVVMTASGTPAKNMKSFLRIAAGKFLDADFSGDVHFGHNDGIVADWSGNVDIRHTTGKALALLTWPALHGHVVDLPVSGRIAVTGTKQGYGIRPQQVSIGDARLSGKMKLTKVVDSAAPKLSGEISLSEASLPTLLAVLMRAPTGKSTMTAGDDAASWPETQFDFNHLTGVSTNFGVKIKSLAVNASGSKLQSVVFRVATGSERISIKKFSASAGKATIKGAADLEKSQAGVKVAAKITGKGIGLGQWAPDLVRTKRLSGTAAINLNLTGQALSPRSLSTLIAGTGEIHLSDVRVPGVTSEAITTAARKVIDGEAEVDELTARLTELVGEGSVELGSPVLKVRIANGTLALPSIVFEQEEGGLRNATFIDLPRWRIDSQWTVTPAPQPRPDAPNQTVPLPQVTIVYNGAIRAIDQIEPKIGIGDLERELIVRKMEANVARLERLRREDEARAAAEKERQRRSEEEQRRSIEEERRRRSQSQQPGAGGRSIQPPQPALVVPPRADAGQRRPNNAARQ